MNNKGKLDANFANKGTLRIDYEPSLDYISQAIELLKDGSVLTLLPIGEDTLRVQASLYDNKGVLDKTFSKNGKYTFQINGLNSATFSSYLQPDGKIVATGVQLNEQTEYTEGAIVRFSVGTTNVANQEVPAANGSLSVFPNPIQRDATVTYTLNESGEVGLQLVDIQGKVIQNLATPSLKNEGSHTTSISIDAGLPAGNYFIRLTKDTQQESFKVVKN